jgi:maltose O-acetyltransferase
MVEEFAMPERSGPKIHGSEKEKMLAGELYLESDPGLTAERRRARRLVRLFNATTEEEPERRRELLRELLGEAGAGLEIEPPFQCDYGRNIFIGRGAYLNFNCVILDANRVDIGEETMIGPAVQLLTSTHPLDAATRVAGPERALPIRVGRRVWIGGGAIIGPGVSIGDDTTIGAGSVVLRDVPAGVLAAGNPCRVIRRLTREI